MTPFSVEEVNSWIGRTLTPPDLATLVDEHLRKMYENVYVHPLSPNDGRHWSARELGCVIVANKQMDLRQVIGVVYMDRVRWHTTTGDVYFCSSDPSFFQKLIDFLNNSEYVSAFVRRSQNVA